MITRVEHFKEQCARAGRLFETRNRQYGDAIKETGVLGAVVELIAVAARLKQLVLADAGGFENDAIRRTQIRNILIDGHNYANIGLMMLDEENWRGE